MKRAFIPLIMIIFLLAGCNFQPITSTDQAVTPSPAISTSVPTVQTSPSATLAPAESHLVAFIDANGNVSLVDPVTLLQTQVTNDASPFSSATPMPVIQYQNPAWSSDGRYLAFERSLGIPAASGYDYSYGLILYDSETGSAKPVIENQQVVGFAWKPGTHQIAYGKAVAPNYFTARGALDSTLATGIWLFDVDSGSSFELVNPEAGYSLADPKWAANGQLISFEEVVYMEGRGPFAFYDFETGKYVSWEKPIGAVDWSKDGSQLLHDNLNYAPSYDERIFVVNRDQSGEKQLSPDQTDGYAYDPHYSPDGKQVAYLSVQGYDTDSSVKITVQNLEGGQLRTAAEFHQVFNLNWTPDGTGLLFAAGDYPDTKVILLMLADGSQNVLASGWQPALQP